MCKNFERVFDAFQIFSQIKTRSLSLLSAHVHKLSEDQPSSDGAGGRS